MLTVSILLVKFDGNNPVWICKQLRMDLQNLNTKTKLSCCYVICNICYNKRERKSLVSVITKVSNTSTRQNKCNHKREDLIKYTDFLLFKNMEDQEKLKCSGCRRFFNEDIGLRYEQQSFSSDDDSCDGKPFTAEV